MKYKEEGNRYYKNSDYARALSSYSKAIELDCSNPIFHSNRAQCKIQMGLPHEAIPDVREAIKLDPSQVKYSYRLAMALSGIGEHEEAWQILTKHSNEHDDIPAAIKREKKYIENSNGIFDMDEMLRLAKEKKEIEIEDYFGPISIELAGEKGRGLFALRDIKKGELVFVSKTKIFAKEPLDIDTHLIPNTKFQMNKVATKLMEIIGKMITQSNPLTICRLAMLFGSGIDNQPLFPSVKLFSPKGYELLLGYEEFYSSKELKVQLLQNISSIVIKNKASAVTVTYILPTLFTLPDIEIGPPASGIWFLFSFLNHSCLPNTSLSFAGNICIARANSDILKGTELMIAYVNSGSIESIDLLTIKERREHLNRTWGFICNCELCQYESDPKNQHLLSRGVKLYDRACKIIAERNNVTREDVNSHFCQLEDLFSEVVKLAEDMGLGADRFNNTVWTVMKKVFYCYMNSTLKFSNKERIDSYFRIMDRAFFCEKELIHETNYWYMYMQMIILRGKFTPSVERRKRVEENFNRVKALQMYF